MHQQFPDRLQALRWQVGHAQASSPFYAERLAGVIPADLAGPEGLPFTTRTDLAERQAEMACLPRGEWADVSRTSGTSGQPIYIPVSLADLERTRAIVARSLEGYGIQAGETTAILLPLDELINPPVVLEHVFRHELRCPTLRIGAVAREKQLQYLRDLQPSIVIGAPTPFLLLAGVARDAGLDPRTLGIRKAILMGQPMYGAGWTPLPVLQGIQEAWGCEVYSLYGTTEWYSAFAECEAHAGHHVQWENLWPEVVDPATGEPLPTGQVGELVVTTVAREAFPLIRYRTGDLTWMVDEPCACGRTTPRVMAVVGRTDDLLKIRGATVAPVELETAVAAAAGAAGYLILLEADAAGNDRLRVLVAGNGDFDRLSAAIRDSVKARTRVTPTVEPAALADLEARWHADGARKPRKLQDLRSGQNRPT